MARLKSRAGAAVPVEAPSVDDLAARTKKLAPPQSQVQAEGNVGGLQHGSMLPSWLTGGWKPSPPIAPLPAVAPSPGIPSEMPTLAGNMPSETPGVPAPVVPSSDWVHSDIFPVARQKSVIDNPNSLWWQGWSLDPGPLRALGQTPAENVTINPETGTMNLAPEALTTALTLGGAGGLRFGREAVPPGLAAREAPLSPEFQANPLEAKPDRAGATMPRGPVSANPNIEPNILSVGSDGVPNLTTKPSETAVIPTPGQEGAPSSVGAAATPLNLTNMDIDQAKAARTTGEISQLMQTPQRGDTTEYVKGVLPTKAEIEQLPAVSRESKMLRQEFREGYNEKEKADNENYHDAYDTLSGTATIVESMERARDTTADAQRKAVWSEKTEADIQPLYDYEQNVLTTEDGRRPVVRSALKRATDELTDADGKPVTDPQMLYGVRKHIDDLIEEKDARGNKANERAMAQLLGLKATLDDVIETAAPGFKKYLSDYSEASKPIDVMKLLQDKKFSLTNGSDRIFTFGKFDKFMKDLVIDRMQKGISQAESIGRETWDALLNIRRSLARSASDQELAKTRGSDSSQLLMELGRKGLLIGAHGVAATVAPGLGNIAIPMVTRAMELRHTRNLLRKHLNLKPSRKSR